MKNVTESIGYTLFPNTFYIALRTQFILQGGQFKYSCLHFNPKSRLEI